VLLKLLASSILLDSLKFALEPGLRGLLVHAPEGIQAEPAKLDPLTGMAVRPVFWLVWLS
jgi:hypothetical protein